MNYDKLVDLHTKDKDLAQEELKNVPLERYFVRSCGRGHLEVAKWLCSVCPSININANYHFAFRWSCANGHLEVAKWLLSVCPTIDINADNDCFFRYSCHHGHLEVAKWLLTVCPATNVNAGYSFLWSCIKSLEIAKWLLRSICPAIDINTYDEYAFRYSCADGHLEVAKWLLSICPTININAQNDSAFRWSCFNGHLQVAKWLLSICPTININTSNDYAFYWSCTNGHLEVAKWLTTLDSNYQLVIKNNEITKYEIMSKLKLILDLENLDEKIKELGIVLISTSNDECAICKEETNQRIILGCDHVYCIDCILRWHHSLNKKINGCACLFCMKPIIWSHSKKVEN